ncbi:MAG: S1C family serine protease, partial [Dehalococcoidia bacterium]
GYIPATLGESDEMTLGEEVIAIGYPLASELGDDLTINRGVVSKLHAQLDELQDLIQTDVDVNPGNSGGPLVNMRGEVVGINTIKIEYTATGRPVSGLNFAIASSYARPIIERLASGENPYWIGANAFTNDPEVADYFDLAVEEGLFVYAVSDGSPAAEVGMETGDVLVTMKGINVYTMADVCDVLRSNPEGQAIPVQVIRGTAALEGEIWGEPLSAKFSLAPEWTTYTRQDLYFSVATPGDWEISEDDTGVTFWRSDAASKTFVSIDAFVFEDLTAEEANQYAIDYFLGYYADIDPEFGSSDIYAFPLGGVEGLTVDYEYLDQDGDLMEGFVIASTIEGWTYVLEAGALERDYEAELEVFNEMLFSLELFPAAAPPSSTAEHLIDTFDDNRNGWYEGEDEAGNMIAVAEEAYHIVSIYEEGVDNFLFGTSGVGPFANFDLDVDASQVEGTNNNEIAVVFGVQDLENLYEFAISGDGYVALGRYVEGAFEFIQEFTSSAAIIQGNATNHIRLIVENGNLTAYVNGELVLTSFAGDYESGYIGFGCGPFEEPRTHCAFDNLDLLALP